MADRTAIELLYTHLGALPHPEYGVINMLPFNHDSEQVRTVKHQVAEAVIDLLDNHGWLADKTQPATPPPNRIATIVKCTSCAGMLCSITATETGVAMVNAPDFIAAISQLNPACPHNPITPEDHLRRMQQRFKDWDNKDENG